MEQFEQCRKTVKLRIFALLALILALLAVVLFGDKILYQMEENVLWYLRGLCASGEIAACLFAVRCRRALRDDTALRKLYNAENDERKKLIRSKAGVPFVLVTSVGMLLAAVVAGYFSLTVFYTLVAAVLAQLVLSCALKLFYSKRI